VARWVTAVVQWTGLDFHRVNLRLNLAGTRASRWCCQEGHLAKIAPVQQKSPSLYMFMSEHTKKCGTLIRLMEQYLISPTVILKWWQYSHVVSSCRQFHIFFSLIVMLCAHHSAFCFHIFGSATDRGVLPIGNNWNPTGIVWEWK